MSNPCKLTQEELKGDLIDRCKACGYFNHQHGFSNPSPTVSDEETSEFDYIDGTDVKKPTIEFLIDDICPHSPLLDFNKQRLLKLIHNKQREVRIDELNFILGLVSRLSSDYAENEIRMLLNERIESLTSEDNK